MIWHHHTLNQRRCMAALALLCCLLLLEVALAGPLLPDDDVADRVSAALFSATDEVVDAVYSSHPEGSMGGDSVGVTLDNDAIGAAAATGESVERAKDIIRKCAVSRVYFVEQVLKATPSDKQREALERLDNGVNLLSIRSGNGVGKTCLCAWVALHYELFRNDVKVVVTSPSSSQLQDGLIPELHKWVRKLPPFLKGTVKLLSNRVVRADDDGVEGADKSNFISFRTARKESPEALAGIHAKYVLCIVDEASGVPDVVFEFAQGTMSTKGAITVLIGNPTRTSGFFYNTHHKLKRHWSTMHISSFETPYVDQDFIDMIVANHGKDSNQYRMRVLGEFPTGEDEVLIPRELVESCLGRAIVHELNPEGAIWGVDPGRGGDPTGFIARDGFQITEADEWNYRDTMATVGRVKEKWDSAGARKPSAIYVDSIGIGSGVADRLRELDLPAVDVNVAETKGLTGEYPRMRDELWWRMRTWFETRKVVVGADVMSPEMWDKFCAEISSPLMIYTSAGKNGVESKAQMKSRGVMSPNLADALMITFAFDFTAATGASSITGKWSKPLDEVALGVW